MDFMGMRGTKLNIFKAAVEMFAHSSYFAISMRDIADAVGIQPASIYNHFGSKDELLSAIFAFYDYNAARHTPDLDKLMSLAEKLRPHELLMKSDMRFGPELQPWMDRILIIAASLDRSDPRAGALLSKWLIEMPRDSIGALLQRLISLKRVAPLDINTFLMLYTNYTYAAALRNYTSYAMAEEDWKNGLSMLFSLVKVV